MAAPKRKSAGPAPVGDVLRGIFSGLDAKKALSEEAIRGAWADAAGPRGARHARPVSLAQKVLRVEVDSPGWMQELTLNKRRVLKKLQTHIGKDKIQEIRFRIGEF